MSSLSTSVAILVHISRHCVEKAASACTRSAFAAIPCILPGRRNVYPGQHSQPISLNFDRSSGSIENEQLNFSPYIDEVHE